VKDLLLSLRPTIFVGSSRKDLQAFPAAVRGEIGQALLEAQLGIIHLMRSPSRVLAGSSKSAITSTAII
jgi:phage-related protein